MTTKKTPHADEESTGVLDDAASLETSALGILGGTAQVSVTLPQTDEDDLADEDVIDGEVVDLIIDEPVLEPAPEAPPAPESDAVLESIVIELPAEEVPSARTETTDAVEADPHEDATVEPVAVPASVAATLESEQAAESPDSDADTLAEAEAEPEPEPESAGETPAADLVDAEETVAYERSPREPPDVVAEEAVAAAAFIARAKADIEAKAAAAAASVSRPGLVKESTVVDTSKKKPVAPQTRASRAEVALTSKRLDDLGDSSRESADLLTADRLLDPHQVAKPEPEGAWSHFLYTVSGRRINIGDGRRARERKALSARISAPLSGGARFVPVLSRKGGVGKTTITALLGMALADAREDRVIAVDANPDRGTLADRIARPNHSKSVRDLVRIHDEVKGYHDISAIVARDATRLDVLASDSDPRIAEAFSDSDYRDVADVAAHYYSLVLTDTGTGIVHSVMSATLDLADQIVIVSGLSVDEARLASETLTWLETNGFADQAREAIIVLNQSTPGAPLVRLNELESHFRTRAKKVVRMPYDAHIAGGGTIVFTSLQPETRVAARELAAQLVEGLRAKAA